MGNPSKWRCGRHLTTIWTALALALWLGSVARAESVKFTFQGQLRDSDTGAPIQENQRIRLTLCASDIGACISGAVFEDPNVVLENGLYTVKPFFDTAQFSGATPRWLQVEVKPANAAPIVPFALITPRVELTYSAFSVFSNLAKSVAWSGVSGAPTSFPPTGVAGGDLNGNYPNPTLRPLAVTSGKLAMDSASLFPVSGGAMTSLPNGNVGIGTSPDVNTRLHVSGGHLRIDNGEIQSWGSLVFHPDVDHTGDDVVAFTDSLGAETMRIDSAGRLGIGTSAPEQLVQVGDSAAGCREAILRFETKSNFPAGVPDLQGASREWEIGIPVACALVQGQPIRPDVLSFVINDTRRGTGPEFVIQQGTGNVGIANNDPAFPLDVSGRSRIRGTNNLGGGIWFTGPASPTSDVSFVGRGSDTEAQTGIYSTTAGWILAAKDNGSVGIGTTNPSSLAKLHVTTSTVGNAAVRGISTVAGTGVYGQCEDENSGIGGSFKGRRGVIGESTHVDGVGGYFVNAAGGLALHAEGRAKVNVLEIAGADVAEKFPASEKLEPGMVVAIDPNSPGKLCLARGAYDRRVAGVVSGANGFSVGAVLGNIPGDEDAPAIALTGRVYVWCDASTSSIEPGDFLTSSDTPGHAMKASDHDRAFGAIIGKAMGELKKGRGLVLVLVSLQ